jgi:hypothetical protein
LVWEPVAPAGRCKQERGEQPGCGKWREAAGRGCATGAARGGWVVDRSERWDFGAGGAGGARRGDDLAATGSSCGRDGIGDAEVGAGRVPALLG